MALVKSKMDSGGGNRGSEYLSPRFLTYVPFPGILKAISRISRMMMVMMMMIMMMMIMMKKKKKIKKNLEKKHQKNITLLWFKLISSINNNIKKRPAY